MERNIKLAAITLFVTVALYTNMWAVAIGIALIAQLLNLFKKPRINAFVLIPISITLIASVCSSVVWEIVGVLTTYIVRVVSKETSWNGSRLWLFFLISVIAIGHYMPYLTVVPVILLAYTLPTYRLSDSMNLSSKMAVCMVVLTVIVSFSFSIWGFGVTRHRAYLQKGVWAQARVPYTLDSLRNASCYSYSEFVNLTKADTISDLNNIDRYNELWIITPTTPFSQQELQKIKNWVSKGGNLIMVDDHTDLYGHARVCSQIAQIFSGHVHNSATFDKHDKQVFNNAYGQPCDIKTGTNISLMSFPLLSAWMWEEDAYYANDNFFGPLAISGDDSYGDKLLMGQLSYGLGQVSFLQDSTIFSNFAVYQPYIMDMARSLSNYSFLARLLLCLPFIMLLGLVLSASSNKRHLSLVSILAILCLPLSDAGDFDYGKNPQIWSGNTSFVQENGCPYTNISTSYSLAALSDRKPLWIDNVSTDTKDVIWVDSVPPKNKNWRWIKVQDIHYSRKNSTSPWDSLYAKLDAPHIEAWDIANEDYNFLKANSVFSDRVMNNWWYNDGISKLRYARIKAWLSWLNMDRKQISAFQYNPKEFTDSLYDAVVRIRKDEPIHMKLPRPKGKNEQEVYLGNGISGVIITSGESISIFGKGQFSENINGPNIWAITYSISLQSNKN